MEFISDSVVERINDLFLIFLCLVPTWALCKKTGKSYWWMVLAVLPLKSYGLLLIFWIFALSSWPIEQNIPKDEPNGN